MAIDRKAVQERLKKFDFSGLFTQELGWDWHTANLALTIDGYKFKLEAVAHKRGMVAYHCPSSAGARIPDYPLRRKIEHQVTKSAREHLIIFTDAAQTTQIWQWVKREPGKPAACRERTYHKGQSGEVLVQRLQEIAFTLEEEEKLTLPDVASRTRKGFDLERVTRKFYDQFQKEHASFLKFIQGITEGTDREWYASVMLNRLMFVYFIQRKGFLDGDEHYLRNRLARCKQEKGTDKFYSFYRYFLVRLFHEGFGKRPKDRAADLEKLVGRIPYLNGGFFEQHQIEQHYKDIEIPDKAFERIFDYFDQYQWHLDERPLRADNEINPDVLGFIFEKYINQKQMGAYYTQEDITGYISRNTIIPFLFDAARKENKAGFEGENSVWKHLQSDPDRYIYPAIKHGITLNVHTTPPSLLNAPLPLPDEIDQGVDATKPKLSERRKAWNKPALDGYALPTEIWREVVTRRQRYEELHSKLAAGEVRDINDLITLNLDIVQFAQDVIRNCDTPELLRAFWQPLEKISVLDPTVGSGAFLFAALNILKPLYEACLERMEAFVGDLDRSGGKHRPEKFKDFREVLEQVDGHPNSDYFILKSIVLNNLYGVDIMEEATEICKLRLFLKLAAQVAPDATKENLGIEPLPDIDFNIRAGNTLVGYATADEVRRAFKEEAGGQGKLLLGETSSAYERFEENVELADRAFRQFREMQTERGMDSSQFASAKVTLRKQMKALEDELNKCLASDCGVKANDKAAYAHWVGTNMPFHWFIEFYGILGGGGFDVIIGNPPYLDLKQLEGYTPRHYTTLPTKNLYSLVLERCERLIKGRQGYIVPISSTATEGYIELQRILSKRELWFASFDDRPAHLFDGLDKNTLSILLLSQKQPQRAIKSSRLNRWNSEERPFLFSRLQFHPTPPCRLPGCLPRISTSMESAIWGKLFNRSETMVSSFSKYGRATTYYSRKVNAFLQILDFVPEVKDGRGRLRPPSEFKEMKFGEPPQAAAAFCLFNSTLFRWFMDVVSDGSHLNRRETDLFPFDPRSASAFSDAFVHLGRKLSSDLKKNSFERTMTYTHDTLTVQCIIPKFSKHILDEIDAVLAKYYGFTDDELDFLVNHDIKYRIGRDSAEDGD